MPAVLITGMSGTGKSSVLGVLRGRGYRGVDTDYDGWVVDVDGDPIWDAARMTALIEHAADELLFVSGCVSNQFDFPFAAKILLSASEDVILERVRSRATNPYGSTAPEQTEISKNLRDIEPLLRNLCDLELDATRPLDELAEEIEKHALQV